MMSTNKTAGHAPAVQLRGPSFVATDKTVSVTTACWVSSLFMTLLVHLGPSVVSRRPQKPAKPSFYRLLRHKYSDCPYPAAVERLTDSSSPIR